MPHIRHLAVAAATVALALPTVAAVPASAGTTTTAGSWSDSALAKRTRHIDSRIVNVTPQKLQLRSKVRNYPRSATFLQKKTCKSCHWKIVDRKQTNRHGRVAYRVYAPKRGRWYYRAGTPERTNFYESYGQTFFTYQY